MKRIVHIFIHNFFITAVCSDQPELDSSLVGVVKKNKVIDASPHLIAARIIPGMSKHQAVRLCPDARFVQLKDEIAAEQSITFALKCSSLSPRVEIINENEAFIDLSGSKPLSIAAFHLLAKALVPSLGSFVTITAAPNRLLARAAALAGTLEPRKKSFFLPGIVVKSYDKMKLLVIQKERTPDLLSFLPVEVMWPLEKPILKRLKTLGLKTFSDVSLIPLTLLYQQFGSLAPIIINFCKGIDDSKVPVFHPPDKIFYHTTCCCSDRVQLETVVKAAAVSLVPSLQDKGKAYRELDLSLFFEDGRRENRIMVFTKGKSDINSLYLDSLNLLNKILNVRINEKVTELTLTAGQLITSPYSQLRFFADPSTLKSNTNDYKKKLAKVCANLAAKYSTQIITTGKNLPVSRREQMLMFVDPFRMS